MAHWRLRGKKIPVLVCAKVIDIALPEPCRQAIFVILEPGEELPFVSRSGMSGRWFTQNEARIRQEIPPENRCAMEEKEKRDEELSHRTPPLSPLEAYRIAATTYSSIGSGFILSRCPEESPRCGISPALWAAVSLLELFVAFDAQVIDLVPA